MELLLLFTFVKENSVQNLVKQTKQTIFPAPDGPPEKVHCVALTSTTIQVSWHPPQPHVRNGLIKGYKVLYAARPGDRPTTLLPLPKTTRLSTVTTVLDHLEKFTRHVAFYPKSDQS